MDLLTLKEVRNGHVDDDNYQHIDGYLTADDSEQGKTIAVVCLDTNKVFFLDNLYRNDTKVKEAIQEVIDNNTNTYSDLDLLRIAASNYTCNDDLNEVVKIIEEGDSDRYDELIIWQPFENDEVHEVIDLILELQQTLIKVRDKK